MTVRKFRIRIEDQWFEVEAEEVSDESAQQQTRVDPRPVPGPSSPNPPLAAMVPSKGEVAITAPLPGTILAINVRVGERVLRGQVLMILEAMKMENEITAHQSGEVHQIMVDKGQSVATGDPLLTLV